MNDVTTFLWVLAAIGAVLLAFALAFGLNRLEGARDQIGPGLAPAPGGPGSRYASDNPREFNPGAFVAALAIVGGLLALILILVWLL
jgi:hypothetical protein